MENELALKKEKKEFLAIEECCIKFSKKREEWTIKWGKKAEGKAQPKKWENETTSVWRKERRLAGVLVTAGKCANVVLECSVNM